METQGTPTEHRTQDDCRVWQRTWDQSKKLPFSIFHLHLVWNQDTLRQDNWNLMADPMSFWWNNCPKCLICIRKKQCRKCRCKKNLSFILLCAASLFLGTLSLCRVYFFLLSININPWYLFACLVQFFQDTKNLQIFFSLWEPKAGFHGSN